MAMLQLHTAALICATVGFLAYLNTLDCQMCYDDRLALIKNVDLRPNVSWANLLWDDFWGTPMQSNRSHKSYRPLCVATFRLNYLVHELQPMGYHLVNVLLHSAVCYLYVQLCGLVFREVWPALIAGLLFAVHPIHTEAVAGIVGRADLLSSAFFLGSIFAYKKALGKKSSLKWLLVAVLLILCSVLSKEIGITAVAVCVIYDFFIVHKMDLQSTMKMLQHSKHFPPWFKKFLGRILILGLFTGGFMYARLKLMREFPAFRIDANPALALPTPYRQLQWMHLCFVNTWLLLNPSSLSCDWRMGAVPTISSVLNPWNLATIVTLSAVAVIGVFSIVGVEKHRKAVLFALSLVVFPYLPASNLFFPVAFVVAERVLYIPSMGYCLLIASGAWSLLRYTNSKVIQNMVKVGLVYLLVVHSIKMLHRNRDWYDSKTVFSSALKVYPDNGVISNILGHQYKRAENYSIAEKLYRNAAELMPDMYMPHLSLAEVMLLDEERVAEAEQLLWKVANLSQIQGQHNIDVTIHSYILLANTAVKNESRWREAVELYDKAIAAKPWSTEALLNKAIVLLKLNETTKAQSAIKKAVDYSPELVQGLRGMCLQFEKQDWLLERCLSIVEPLGAVNVSSKLLQALELMNDKNDVAKLQEAQTLVNEVIVVEPNNDNAWYALGSIYKDLGNIQKAEEMLLKALDINSTHAGALYRLGLLYRNSQRYKEAVGVLSKLLKLEPEHQNTLIVLAMCHTYLQEFPLATEMYEKALKIDPTRTIAWSNLGGVRAQLGEHEEAVRLFEHALQLDPSSEAARNGLIQAQRELALKQPLS